MGVLGLTPAQKLSLAGHMPAVQAEEEMARGEVPDHRIWRVVFDLTGDKDKADEAYAERLMNRMRKGQ